MRCCLCSQTDLPNGANGRHYLCCAPLYGNYFSWLKQYKTDTLATQVNDSLDSRGYGPMDKDMVSAASSDELANGKTTARDVKAWTSRHQTQGVCSSCAGGSCQALPSYRRYRLLDRGELTQGEISLLRGQKANGFYPRNACHSYTTASPSPPASVRSSATTAAIKSTRITNIRSKPTRSLIAPNFPPAPVGHTKKQRRQPAPSSLEPVLSKVEPLTTVKMPHLYWKFVSRVSLHKSLLHRAANRSRSRTLTPMAGLTGEGVRLWQEFYRRCTAGEEGEKAEETDDNDVEKEKPNKEEEEQHAAYDGRQTRQRIAALQDKLMDLVPPGPPPVTPASRLSRFTSRQTSRSLTPHMASSTSLYHQLWPDTPRRNSLTPPPSDTWHLHSPIERDVRSTSVMSSDTACLPSVVMVNF